MTSQVNLTNCDREPIHIPGSIQPHGALLAFDANQALTAHSANAAEILGRIGAIGETVGAGAFDRQVEQVLTGILSGSNLFPEPVEVVVGGNIFDVTSHKVDGQTVVEFEPRPWNAPHLHAFAYKAQESLSKIQAMKSLDELLEASTRAVREITGFDRVMCYRFRHDDTGDVVVEEKHRNLDPLLGLRFPTSDIPVQARSLYVRNTLRFIVDVDAVPSPLVPPLGPDTSKPLDLSQSNLRSVSPIHIQYLRNMTVTASLSISIVVKGRLWGLFACHHFDGPLVVAHAVRVTCKLIAQIVSVMVERLESEQRFAYLETTHEVIEKMLSAAKGGVSILSGVLEGNLMSDLIPCDGFGGSKDGRLVTRGNAPSPELITRFLDKWQGVQDAKVFYTHNLAQEFPEFEDHDDVAGLLAIRFDQEHNGWLFWFRNSQSTLVRWAGKPDKISSVSGDKTILSPRESFAAYLEQVKEIASPWTEGEIEAASHLRVGLQEIAYSQISEESRARELLVAALGHDLRSPLHALDMTAYLMGVAEKEGDLPGKIVHYTSRIKRLVDHMLDFSRIQSGLNLGVRPMWCDPVPIVTSVIEEICSGFPGFVTELREQMTGEAYLDPDRFVGVIMNLLTNAMHHGDPASPAIVTVSGGGDQPFTLEVANKGSEIPADRITTLFEPLKGTANQGTNRSGLGLGLFIVKQVVTEHGGTIELLPYKDGMVTFRLVFPGESVEA